MEAILQAIEGKGEEPEQENEKNTCEVTLIWKGELFPFECEDNYTVEWDANRGIEENLINFCRTLELPPDASYYKLYLCEKSGEQRELKRSNKNDRHRKNDIQDIHMKDTQDIHMKDTQDIHMKDTQDIHKNDTQRILAEGIHMKATQGIHSEDIRGEGIHGESVHGENIHGDGEDIQIRLARSEGVSLLLEMEAASKELVLQSALEEATQFVSMLNGRDPAAALPLLYKALAANRFITEEFVKWHGVLILLQLLPTLCSDAARSDGASLEQEQSLLYCLQSIAHCMQRVAIEVPPATFSKAIPQLLHCTWQFLQPSLALHALRILNSCLSSPARRVPWCRELHTAMQRIAAAKGEQHCYAHLVPILRLTRELSVATLHFINSMLRAAYSEEATASILAHMDTLALHAALKELLFERYSAKIQQEIHDYVVLRLVSMREDVATPFDEEQAAHRELLQQLWRVSFPAEPYQSESPNWQLLGFQGNRAGVEIKSTGVWVLKNMLHFMQHYSNDFHHIIAQNNKRAAESKDYPFAVTCVLLSQLLYQRVTSWLKVARQENDSVYSMLLEGEEPATVLYEVFAVHLQLLEYLWAARDCSWSDFQSVSSIVCEGVQQAIAASHDWRSFRTLCWSLFATHSREPLSHSSSAPSQQWLPGSLSDHQPDTTPVTAQQQSLSRSSSTNSTSSTSSERKAKKLQHILGEGITARDLQLSQGIAPDQSVSGTGTGEKALQPASVNVHKLNRFFGTKAEVSVRSAASSVEDDEDEAFSEETHNMNSLRSGFKVQRVLGERIDVAKESRSSSVSAQPLHVSAHKLSHLFGEPTPIERRAPDAASNLDDSASERGVDAAIERGVDALEEVPMKGNCKNVQDFFGEEVDPIAAQKWVSYAPQPQHVKTYKLKKKFGETVAVEKRTNNNNNNSSVLQPLTTPPSTSPATATHVPTDAKGEGAEEEEDKDILSAFGSQLQLHTDYSDYTKYNTVSKYSTQRKLHVFFGTRFDVNDVAFSEKMLPPLTGSSTGTGTQSPAPQPNNVKLYKLKKIFGTEIPVTKEAPDEFDIDSGEESEGLSTESRSLTNTRTHSRSQTLDSGSLWKVKKLLGEHIDLHKERHALNFAPQPPNVQKSKLNKVFGELSPEGKGKASLVRDESQSTVDTDISDPEDI